MKFSLTSEIRLKTMISTAKSHRVVSKLLLLQSHALNKNKRPVIVFFTRFVRY